MPRQWGNDCESRVMLPRISSVISAYNALCVSYYLLVISNGNVSPSSSIVTTSASLLFKWFHLQQY